LMWEKLNENWMLALIVILAIAAVVMAYLI
jgi:hypothetical protein